MKTASELFKEFLPSVRTPQRAASLFATDGALELPYLSDLGMPWQYRGREGIAGLYARLLENGGLSRSAKHSTSSRPRERSSPTGSPISYLSRQPGRVRMMAW
jgi:hypothetical protein